MNERLEDVVKEIMVTFDAMTEANRAELAAAIGKLVQKYIDELNVG